MSRYNRKRSRSGEKGSVIGAICLTLFIFSGAVVLTLFSRWLYYLDITLLDIPSYAKMSREVIRANYDALIDYCAIWHREDLVFPTLTMSETGHIHFQECKRIFDLIQILFVLSGVGSVITVIRNRGRRKYLRTAGVLTLVIPLILGALAAVSWNRFFTIFHKLFFRNDYWLFDPITDPVILILPDRYFFHCAVLILLTVMAAALVCLRISGRRKRRR